MDELQTLRPTAYKNRTQVPKALTAVEKVSIKKALNSHLPSPEDLVEIAGAVVNDLPLPIAWDWGPEEVANWVASELHLPQYQESFIRNRVNGRTLLLVEASALPKMNITNFEHIKVISAAIRKLYGVEREYFKRSLSLPWRFPETCFLLQHLRTGPAYSEMTRTQLFRLYGLVGQPRKKLIHWDLVDPHVIEFPGKILVGRPGVRTLCNRCVKEKRY